MLADVLSAARAISRAVNASHVISMGFDDKVVGIDAAIGSLSLICRKLFSTGASMRNVSIRNVEASCDSCNSVQKDFPFCFIGQPSIIFWMIDDSQR